MAGDPRDTELRELDALRQTVADQSEHLDSLQERNGALAAQVAELRNQVRDAHESLARRDEELVERENELMTRRSKELKARDDEVRWLRDVVEDLRARLDASEEAGRSRYLSRLNARFRSRRS
jgi:peptidoglycan hydrolase CwlO-like protein